MKHELKSWPEFYQAVVEKRKTFEIRRDDRGFKVGDYLVLTEWDDELSCYTGRAMVVEVTYIAKGVFGLPPDVVVMSIR